MPEIKEVTLPGVGVRHEFMTSSGQRLAVVSHRGGRREISLSRRDDPDACATLLELSADDAAALSDILGAPRMAPAASAMQQVEGLALDWLTVSGDSPASGKTIGEGGYRQRTGASIVALVRGRETVPAPGAEVVLAAGDVVVAVGTAESLAQLRQLLRA